MSVYFYNRISVWQYFLVFSFLVFLDQVSKFLAGKAELVTMNYDISFGWKLFENGSNQILMGFFLLMIVGILFSTLHKLNGWTLGNATFLAGAVSNILDRFLVGGVRDWLPLPIFNLQNNLADWFIFVGVVGIGYGVIGKLAPE